MLTKKSKLIIKTAYSSGYGDLYKQDPTYVRNFFESKARNDHVKGIIKKNFEIINEGFCLSAREYIPNDIDLNQSLICFFHGGGYVFGSLETSDYFCCILAKKTRAKVISIDYSLSPEEKHPTQINEAKAAISWIDQNLSFFDIKSDGFILCGESSGGNIVAVLSQSSFFQNIAGQILISPSLDYVNCYESKLSFSDGYLLDSLFRNWLANNYLVSESQRNTPEVSPLLSNNISLSPDTLIIVAECDPLKDEAYLYNKKLQMNLVDSTLSEVKGVFHGFHHYHGILPEVGSCLNNIAQWVNSHNRALLATTTIATEYY